VPQEEQVQGEATQERERFREEIRKFERCISEECFRWGVGLCMDIKREYWDYYLECLRVRASRPDLVPTLDMCHERALNEVMPKYNFLSRDAIMECIIS